MQTKLCQIFGNKKKLPSNKEDMLESFSIDRVVQSDYYNSIRLDKWPTLPPILIFLTQKKKVLALSNVRKKYFKNNYMRA